MLEGIAVGLISSAAWTLCVKAGQRLELLATGRSPATLLADDLSLKALVDDGLSGLSTEPGSEDLRLFLESPECLNFAVQAMATVIPTDEVEGGPPLREEFDAIARDQLPDRSVAEIAMLFNAIQAATHHAVESAVDRGILAGHEALSADRHRAVLDEIRGLRRSLEFLEVRSPADRESAAEFEQAYRRQVADRHALIQPPQFEGARKLPLDAIYVSPSFRAHGSADDAAIALSDLMSTVHRAVILGNPGGGKSTLAAKLCHDLASDPPAMELRGAVTTPILVVLREYGQAKKQQPCSLTDFIEQTARSRYQLAPPARAFEQLLLTGQALVIFDGLDELLDTADRQDMTADVESFCNLYPSVPVIVTSRQVGYTQAPLDPRRFEPFVLVPFDDGRVAEYANKWFSADQDLPEDQRDAMAGGFLRESAIVPDLRSNPLMLALMCNIYRGENYIPTNRPDVYEKCALMLFQRWDRSRGIDVSLPIEAHVERVIQHLAFQIYEDADRQGGVPERMLVQWTTDYLLRWRYEDEAEALHAAQQFVEFCRGRAWVFTDTGTTRDGEPLYQFTHRTFLEFFAAAYLVRTNPTPEQLNAVLRPRIERQEWDVVAQLAYQRQNRTVEGASDELLTGLLQGAAEGAPEIRWNSIYFAARALEYMVPTPRTVRAVVREATVEALAGAASNYGSVRRPEDADNFANRKPASLLGALLTAATENRDVVRAELIGLLSDRIERGDATEGALALELAATLDGCVSSYSGLTEANPAVSEYWQRFDDEFYRDHRARAIALAPSHYWPAFEVYRHGDASAEDVAGWHGHEALLKSWSHSFGGGFWYISIAEQLLVRAIADQADEASVGQLEELERVLTESPLPWQLTNEFFALAFPFSWARPEEEPSKHVPLTRGALSGALLVAAILIEAQPPLRTSAEKVTARSLGPLEPFKEILTARPDAGEELIRLLRSQDLTDRTHQLMEGWMTGAVSFLSRSGRRSRRASRRTNADQKDGD